MKKPPRPSRLLNPEPSPLYCQSSISASALPGYLVLITGNFRFIVSPPFSNNVRMRESVQTAKMANHQALVYCIGSQAFVTVNRGGDQVRQPPTIRHVTVTPLILASTVRVTSTLITLRKLLIKAVHEGEKERKTQTGKIFTQRNISIACMSKLEDLKSLIEAQLSDDLLDRFNVGYVQNNKVSLRSKEDIRDLIGSIQ